MAGNTMEAASTPDTGSAAGDLGVPAVIKEFYKWAERSSKWEIEMYEWATKLKDDLAARDIPMTDNPPPPPKRWPPA